MISTIQNPSLQVRLINLRRSVQRRAKMQQRLAELGLTYTIFNAVDGIAERDRLSSKVNVKAFQRNVGRDILLGEVGCYISHISVWQEFLETNEDVLLVLEDDVVFEPDFIDALQLALKVVHAWDFLKLNKIRAKQPICQGLIGAYRLNAYLGPATGLGAYLIKRETVCRLLPAMLPITRPLDHELDLIHIHNFRHFGLEPFPSHVRDDNESTITGQAFNAIHKYSWYRRLPVYTARFDKFFRRLSYLTSHGRLKLLTRKSIE